MREIKFRGFDLDTKRWYYGSYVRLERISGYAMSQTPEEDNKKHQENDFDDYIFFTEMNDWGLETKKLRATVDVKSVGQYTGLKDKNGIDVYESDLLGIWMRKGKDRKQYIHQIKWNDEKACFDLPAPLNEFEVIGNIYENKELLK
jgi:uncharacterized phage protein (TIGR01671 family)